MFTVPVAGETPDFVSRVLDIVPEFSGPLASAAELYDDSLSAGTVFAELAAFLGERAMRPPFPSDLIESTLGLIEDLLSCSPSEVADEIGASFLGNLPLLVITSSLPWMGPETMEMLESLDCDWR